MRVISIWMPLSTTLRDIADKNGLHGVSLIILAAGILMLYALSAGLGNPSRQSARKIGRATWIVPPVIVVVSALLGVLSAPSVLGGLVEAIAAGLACTALRLGPAHPVPKRGRSRGSRTAPPSDPNVARRAAILLASAALQVVAFFLG